MRDLEDKLSGPLNAFQRGNNFSKGEKVVVSGEPIVYERYEGIAERRGFNIIYLAFGFVFFLLFLLNGYRFYIAVF